MSRHKRKREIFAYTYLLINRTTGDKYYGVRWKNVKLSIPPCDDIGKKYFTSSKYMSDFRINPSNYKIIIHFTFDSAEEALLYESKFLSRVFRKDDWVNRTDNHAIINTEEEISKISDRVKEWKSKNQSYGKEHPMWGKKHSTEAKNSISKKAKDRYRNGFTHPRKGVKHTDEAKKKMSESRKGKTLVELIGTESASKNIEARRKKTILRNKTNNCMKDPEIRAKATKSMTIKYDLYRGIEYIGSSDGNAMFIDFCKSKGISIAEARRINRNLSKDGYFVVKSRTNSTGGVTLA